MKFDEAAKYETMAPIGNDNEYIYVGRLFRPVNTDNLLPIVTNEEGNCIGVCDGNYSPVSPSYSGACDIVEAPVPKKYQVAYRKLGMPWEISCGKYTSLETFYSSFKDGATMFAEAVLLKAD